MSLFYEDKKMRAANAVLAFLVNNHCHHYRDGNNLSAYKSDVVAVEYLATKIRAYQGDLLIEGVRLLALNGHIEYEVQNFAYPIGSKIKLLESGRLARKSSFYNKILIKKWGKRGIVFIGVILTAILIWINGKRINEMPNKTIPRSQQKGADTIGRKQ